MRGRWEILRDTPVPFFFGALLPAAITIPLRLLLFGDTHPFTQIVLGPLLEESVKLGGVFLALTLAALLLPRGRDPAMVFRYWLFLAPGIFGGLFGLGEGILVYPGQGGLNFSLREAAHASFSIWATVTTLLVWRRLDAGAEGTILGVLAGFLVHLGFNLVAWLPGDAGALFWGQTAYVGLMLAAGLAGLVLVVRDEPSSAEAQHFLTLPGRG